MSTRRERVAPAVMLLLFGGWPWVLVGAYRVADANRLVRSSTISETVIPIVLGFIGLGVLAALVALIVGLRVAWRRRGARSDSGLPQRPSVDGESSTVVARAAGLAAVITLWGPFAFLMIAPAFERRSGGLDERVSWSIGVVTVLAALAGATLLVRSRRQRSK